MSEFRRVVINAAWNLLGTILPLGVAVAAIPFLLGAMGPDRFGLLGLAWALVGYFTLFDLGLGRALTKLIAERNVSGFRDQLSTLCSTGLALVGILGLAAAVLMAAAMPLARPWVNSLPPWLVDEVGPAATYIAISIPVVVATSALQGIMEGFQQFRRLNAIRMPAGIAMFLAPCLSVWCSPRLDWAIASLMLTRVAVLGVYVLECRKLVRLTPSGVRREWIAPMWSFGGWLTVSNVVGPIIVYSDRFIVGALLTTSVLPYYIVPSEVVGRLLLLPIAFAGALFPALSQAQSRGVGDARALRKKSLRLTLSMAVPIALLAAALAEPILRLWLGAEFAIHSTRILQFLLIGFVFNALAQIPYASLQGIGNTRQAALLHCLEAPLYLGVFVLLVQEWQLEGAAFAWALRAMMDWLALSWILRSSERRLFNSGERALRDAG